MIRFLNSLFFTKEKAEYLKKIRIIKTELIHVHGFSKSLAQTSILNSPEYFGQYGAIVNSIISEKTNPDTKKKSYSAYITYSNKIEASLAILCVDSLMYKGKLIRTFFGTNKYCNYFLNNLRCPNSAKCPFLHQYSPDKDIAIEPETIFTYDEHLDLARKMLDISNPQTRNLLRAMEKPEKNVFPTVDFIYMDEEEKENYFSKGNLTYIKGTNNGIKNYYFSNFNINKNINKLNHNNNSIYINVYNSNDINKKLIDDSIDNINSPKETIALHKIFSNSIKYILLLKPFLNRIDKKFIKKMEFIYIKSDLMKKGLNINKVLYGCLDCMKDVLN